MEIIAAAQRGDAAAVAQLLAADTATPNAKSAMHGMPALHWACASDEVECARELLADPRTDRHATSAHGMTALHIAASASAPRTLEFLLAEGFAVDAVNEWSESYRKYGTHTGPGS